MKSILVKIDYDDENGYKGYGTSTEDAILNLIKLGIYIDLEQDGVLNDSNVELVETGKEYLVSQLIIVNKDVNFTEFSQTTFMDTIFVKVIANSEIEAIELFKKNTINIKASEKLDIKCVKLNSILSVS